MNLHEPAFSEQVPLNQAVVQCLTELLPPSWRAIELRLEFGRDAEHPQVSHQVTNPDTGEGGTVSDELAAATLALDAHRRKFELKWLSAIFIARPIEPQDWQVSATFR